MKFWIPASALLVLSAVSLFFFQNCSVPVQEEMQDLTSLAEKAPFAYDARFDQLAYMSCSEMRAGTYDAGAYFTFRAGAYDSGGLKLRDSYFDNLEKYERIKLPTDEEKLEYLGASPVNSNTRMQFSLLNLSDFQRQYVRGTSVVEDQDFSVFFPTLGGGDDAGIMTALLNLAWGERLRYLRNGNVGGMRFEANVHFGDSTTLQESLRQGLSSDGVLALTFSDEERAGEAWARSPAEFEGYSGSGTARNSVFGNGLIVRFRQPTPVSGSIYGQFPNHVLREVSEINLEDRNNRSDVSPWSCPTNLQFRIVRPADLNIQGVNCVVAPDPTPYSADLDRVRKSLRVEDWYVDMANRCIVPKKSEQLGCYGNIKTIQHNLAQGCTPANDNEQCVHFASICFRQSP